MPLLLLLGWLPVPPLIADVEALGSIVDVGEKIADEVKGIVAVADVPLGLLKAVLTVEDAMVSVACRATAIAPSTKA